MTSDNDLVELVEESEDYKALNEIGILLLTIEYFPNITSRFLIRATLKTDTQNLGVEKLFYTDTLIEMEIVTQFLKSTFWRFQQNPTVSHLLEMRELNQKLEAEIPNKPVNKKKNKL